MGEGTPLHGDRSAWDVLNHEDEHGSDIEAGTPTRHVPLPGAAGRVARSDGSKWVGVTVSGDVVLAADGVVTVDGLQGRDVASDAPADSQALVWNNGASQWEPQDQSGGSASQIGQVWFSLNGAAFTAQLPLTDNGWLVEEVNGVLLVVDVR